MIAKAVCHRLVDASLLAQADYNNVIDEVQAILNKLVETKYAHGYYMPSLVAAIIYIAIRRLGLALTMHDIVNATNDKRVTIKEVNNAYKRIMIHLEFPSLPPLNYSGLVDTLATKLQAAYPFLAALEQWEEAKNSAKNLINSISIRSESIGSGSESGSSKQGLGLIVAVAEGRDPRCVVAAALYKSLLDHGIHLTQNEIASVASITAVSLRHAYHALFMPHKAVEGGGKEGRKEGERGEVK